MATSGRAVWAPALERAVACRLGLHILRHSAAAGVIRAGWSPKAVQQTLGHASIAFSLTVYGHLFDDDLDELAAALEAGASPNTRRTDSQTLCRSRAVTPSDLRGWWWGGQGSNLRPTDYESAALTD